MVDDETETVTSCGHCVSDDQHIVALARIGKARLLCSNDDALTTDFRNPVLISKPRGKVYKRRGRKFTSDQMWLLPLKMTVGSQ